MSVGLSIVGRGNEALRIPISLWTCYLYAVSSLMPLGSGILRPQFSPDLWFPMDSDTITDLILGPDINGQLTGAPDLVPGVLQSGLELNMGTTIQLAKFVNVQDTCFTDPSNCSGLTVALWIKLGPPRSSFVTYFSTEGQTTEPTGVAIYQKDGYLVTSLTTTESRYNVTIGAANITGLWTHIAMAWKPNWGLDLLINGKLNSFDSYGTKNVINEPVSGELVLGSTGSSSVHYDTCGSAVFDNLLVWYKFISAEEVVQIYYEDRNLLMSTLQTLTFGNPINILMEDGDVSTCATLQATGSSKRSTMVELKWMTEGHIPGESTQRIVFAGSYNIDSLKVYTSGESQGDECSRLTECEIDPYDTGSRGQFSQTYACDCQTNACGRVFLDTAHAKNSCGVNWTYCQPIKVCYSESQST